MTSKRYAYYLGPKNKFKINLFLNKIFLLGLYCKCASKDHFFVDKVDVRSRVSVMNSLAVTIIWLCNESFVSL